ncbi:hypothetical protein [Polyangium mundeleinium]|uniref:Uncharacterized protein n=1 Tax=Polyangium mundeleinium TaxID=2995306 RepID=A0ABT5ESX5_9BACT|nr:hypothetical protein [Polyangium mundeleinium]MDC0744457.1 hypothetical protein [Polyangium mundeleinium]
MRMRPWAGVLAWVMGAMVVGAGGEARAEDAEDVGEERAAVDEASEALVTQGICELCRRTCARGRCLPICARIRCAPPDWRDRVYPPWRWREELRPRGRGPGGS